jgi:hypothetical protein
VNAGFEVVKVIKVLWLGYQPLLIAEVFDYLGEEKGVFFVHQGLLDWVTLEFQEKRKQTLILVEVLSCKKIIDLVHAINKSFLDIPILGASIPTKVLIQY